MQNMMMRGRPWHTARYTVLLLLGLGLLLGLDRLCYHFTLPVSLENNTGKLTLHVGNTVLPIDIKEAPESLQFDGADPVVHEYQIDGSDSTNNFTLDRNYLDQISTTPYYRFQAWMRDLAGTSQWRNVHIHSPASQRSDVSMGDPADGSSFPLPGGTGWQVTMQLQRPETQRTISLIINDQESIHILINRNDRFVQVIQSHSGLADVELNKSFFPTDALPFGAMVLDLLVRVLLWALVLLVAILLCEMIVALLSALLLRQIYFSPSEAKVQHSFLPAKSSYIPSTPAVLQETLISHTSFPRAGLTAITEDLPHSGDFAPEFYEDHYQSIPFYSPNTEYSLPEQPSTNRLAKVKNLLWLRTIWQKLVEALHPIALLALCLSFLFVAWIARVQYNGQPHIYDANAYLFAAKMYAQGHLSVPVPPAASHFPGPFMITFQGRWFAQYPPGTALTLVPGLWLGAPWLVEPVLGTLALLGIGLVAARLYNRQVATLAVLLGTFSPFYSYLAASYLSHAIALFYLIWGLWAFLRFTQGGARWNLLFAAFLLGMGALTRDLVGILFAGLSCSMIVLLYRQQIWQERRRWKIPATGFFLICLFFGGITLAVNQSLTGDPFTSARTLFFAGDRWGFGPGIGFYGQHTVAAGLVNLDEILTILSIDLYGWPFYLTLAFMAIPFLTLRARMVDWLCLACVCLIAASFVGYFYHGIYLGPRYLFETLPFLLILTARGILTLIAIAKELTARIYRTFLLKHEHREMGLPFAGYLFTTALMLCLLSCNVFYYLPRQIVLYQNYSGLSAYPIDLPVLYRPDLHHAIIVTENYAIYQMVLFPLNDPQLQGDLIYALASDATDYQQLQTAFPGRKIYHLDLNADGTIHYTQVGSADLQQTRK